MILNMRKLKINHLANLYSRNVKVFQTERKLHQIETGSTQKKKIKYQAIYRLENYMSEKTLVREYIKNSQTSVGEKKYTLENRLFKK